jgi:hypothetical protein
MRSRLWKKFEEFKQEYGKAKYAYAATFHGAQGSTKEYVALDEQNLNEHFDSRICKCTNLTEQTELLTQRNELLYVAVTRSRQGTFVFNQQAELAQQYNRHSDNVWYLPDELKPIPSTPALHGEKNAPTPKINPQPEGILSVEQGIIVQQVNCQKVMGAGLASAISQKYPQVKEAYLNREKWSLGRVLTLPEKRG